MTEKDGCTFRCKISQLWTVIRVWEGEGGKRRKYIMVLLWTENLQPTNEGKEKKKAEKNSLTRSERHEAWLPKIRRNK